MKRYVLPFLLAIIKFTFDLRRVGSLSSVVIAVVVLLSFYVLGCVYAQPSPLQHGTMLQNDGSGRFFHTPELWLGPILGLAGCFGALGVFYVPKRKRL